jgi:hypothetical protein
MRKTILTLTLILALTGITPAGDMQQPVAPPPSPPPAQGEMGQPVVETIAAIIEIAFSLG